MDYAWQFGDSTKASTRDTTISHIYDSAGTYTVQVALTDTILHQTIAKQTGQMKIMPLNAPTLTLIVPDTNYWGDSCVMSVSSSQSLKPGWKFSWSLGDSTTVTGTDSVLHYYLTPGNYKVTVSLNDTVHHILLASKSVIVPVVPRHFNLALLQSMPYVDVTWNATVGRDTISGVNGPCDICGDYLDNAPFGFINPLTWSGMGFDAQESVGFNDGNSAAGSIDSESAQYSVAGSVDPLLTQLVGISEDSNTYSYYTDSYTDPNFSLGTYQSSFSVNDIPFKSESDTDLVFEAIGKASTNAVYSSSLFDNGGNIGELNVQSQFNQVFSIIIRFHK